MRKLSFILLLCATGLANAQEEGGLDYMRENFDMNLYIRSSYENHSNDASADGFKINEARMEVMGKVIPNLEYRIRFRLNKNFNIGEQESASSALDYAYAKYSFGNEKRWSATVGKQMNNLGSWELYDNPTFEYQYSDHINRQQNIFATGIQFAYQVNDKNSVHLQATNTTDEGFESSYEATGYAKNGNAVSKIPVNWNLTWKGKLFDDKVQTIYTAGFSQFADKKNNFNISLGNKFIFGKVSGYLDLSHTNLALDHFNGVSPGLNTYFSGLNPGYVNVYAQDVAYQTASFRINVPIADKWFIQGKTVFERGLNRADNNLPDQVVSNNINLFALEFKPFETQYFKLFGYFSNTNRKDHLQHINTTDNIIGIGALYFLNVL